MIKTNHFKEERQTRANILEELKAPILSVNGKLCIFIIDKGHKDGKEIHVITENGIIHIYNQHSKRYITGLIARPAQLMRYGVNIPDNVIKAACYSIDWIVRQKIFYENYFPVCTYKNGVRH